MDGRLRNRCIVLYTELHHYKTFFERHRVMNIFFFLILIIRTAIGKVCNITLSENQWLQASLLIRSERLGFRRVS